MRAIYIADDGKEFGNESECEHYEWLLSHPHLGDIKCYDKAGNGLGDIMEDSTYQYCHKIIALTDEAVKDLNDLADYAGYCYYSHITGAGTWIYEEKETDGRFMKVSDEVGLYKDCEVLE